MSERSVLVIGAGVAGSVAAIRLRQLGIHVTLVEKSKFPRRKVCGCCIGGAGLNSFSVIGQRDWVVQQGEVTRGWKSSIAGRTVELTLPDGVAISRETLDTGLLDAAEASGAEVHRQCQASIDQLAANQVSVTLRQQSETVQRRFDLVVMAGGLNAAGLNQWLPWRGPPHGPFGASFDANIDGIDAGVIYMACDDDGYVGLVQLEDGRVDVAAALISGSRSASVGSPRERIGAILERSEFDGLRIDRESELMTTPPLRRSRPAGTGRLIVIGDAAGYVEPFTGEGMTWAAQSAIAAAETIAAHKDWTDIGDRWDKQSRTLLRRKKLACRTITSALRSSTARRMVAFALSNWPQLANPLIQDLNHP